MSREKQIDKMARIIDDNHGFIVSSVETAKALYNAGYRKQRVGEWKTEDTMLGKCCTCSVCGSCPTMEYRYCPYCGAKMEGGAE